MLGRGTPLFVDGGSTVRPHPDRAGDSTDRGDIDRPADADRGHIQPVS